MVAAHGWKKIMFLKSKNQIFLNQIFFSESHIFVIFRLYYAVKHQYQDCESLSSIVICALHRIKVPEPVTVKSVVEELNKRIKQYICFCLL